MPQQQLTNDGTSWNLCWHGTSRMLDPGQKWFNNRRRAEDLFMSHSSQVSAISNTPSLRNSSNNARRVSCFGERPSKMSVDTEQFSRSKEIQLRDWRQPNVWIRSALARLVKPTTWNQPLRRCTYRKRPDCYDCERRSAHRCGLDCHPVEGPNNRTRLENWWFTLKRNLYGHPLAGLLWGRTLEEVLLKQIGEKVRPWKCLHVNVSAGCEFAGKSVSALKPSETPCMG